MTKKRKILNTIFKILVISASYVYIVKHLQGVELFQIKGNILSEFGYFSLAFLLMFVNWSLEALKWKFLLKDIQEISFFAALKNISIGIVFGLFTPNRLGEIGGRAFYLQKDNRLKGALAASVGSLAQLTITAVFGILGFSVLIFLLKTFEFNHSTAMAIALVAMAMLLLLMFFNLEKFINFAKKLKLSDKLISKMSVLANYPTKSKVYVLIFSMLRYMVFVFQFYLLLLLFGVNIEFFVAIVAIFTVFLIMNIFPNVVIADLGIRGSVSMFVLGQFASNIHGILFASILLWIINILLPAIVGQIFITAGKTAEYGS